MEFEVKTPSRTQISKLSNNKLTLYVEPPEEDVTLLEIEELVKERLEILKGLEQLKERHSFLSAPFKTEFEKFVINKNPLFIGKCSSHKVAEFTRRDEISHFLLCLGACMDQDKTNWFITQEIDLLKIRIHYVGSSSLMEYLSTISETVPIKVSEEEVKQHHLDLSNGNNVLLSEIYDKPFYKMPFTDCLDLVRTGKVFIHDGYCYATINDLTSFLTQKFRLLLSRSMNKQRLSLAELNEDDRVLPLLFKILYTGVPREDKENDGREIKVEDVDYMAANNFPLCMRGIHNRLRTDHHLKYFARQQYGLFLKGAGLSMDDSIAFFRSEFTKEKGLEKFNKEYVYNIRHMFGKEGNRIDHKPMPCSSIILNNTPATDDCHGCPFKHNTEKQLSQRLSALKLDDKKIHEITKLANEHRYDFACTRTFEYTHGLTPGGLGKVITNPNDYLDYSLAYKKHQKREQ